MAISILREYLSKEKRDDGKVSYVIDLNEKDIENIKATKKYNELFLILEKVYTKQRNYFEIEKARLEHVFNNNNLEITLIDISFKYKEADKLMHMDIESRINYKNRGIKKEIHTPNLQRILNIE